MSNRDLVVYDAIRQTDHPDISRRELADVTGIDYRTVEAITASLHAAGCITVSRHVGHTIMYHHPGGEGDE